MRSWTRRNRGAHDHGVTITFTFSTTLYFLLPGAGSGGERTKIIITKKQTKKANKKSSCGLCRRITLRGNFSLSITHILIWQRVEWRSQLSCFRVSLCSSSEEIFSPGEISCAFVFFLTSCRCLMCFPLRSAMNIPEEVSRQIINGVNNNKKATN